MARLLITGGTGSFGSATIRRFLNDDSISKIIVFSRDEKKQHDMRHEITHPKVDFIIGDVRDKDSILQATKNIDYIFHAAALKHVPTGEYFPVEMIKTNILGTENVLSAANENGVKKVVLLSTDKAVYPINAMGMTKAIAEKLLGAKARNSYGTIFCAVRYGNVMATRGSVIPLFIDQIKKGKPISITDPNMTRFLLSLDDSIDLVHLAIKKGKQGDLFIKKAPATTIGDLAQAVVNIFGAKNEIKIVGVRAGEKLHESLATQLELARSEDLGDHFRIKDATGYEYQDYYGRGVTSSEIKGDYTSENTRRLTLSEIEKLLLSLPYVQEELKLYRSNQSAQTELKSSEKKVRIPKKSKKK